MRRRPPSPGTQWGRGGTGLALVAGANYCSSLNSLSRGRGLDTPLRHLGLVPLTSLIRIATKALAPHPKPDILGRFSHDIIVEAKP